MESLLFFLLGLLIFGRRKNKKFMYNEQDAKEAIKEVEKQHGKEMAKLVEKMFRLETNHFKSLQYRLTGTAGMESGKWGKYLPKGLKTTTAVDDKIKTGQQEFIVWNPKDFALFLASYINRNLGNFARWNTTDANGQKIYASKVNSVKNRFV